MGRRGPTAKPTALKIAAGNPGHERLSKDEPKPLVRSSLPKPPPGLDSIAREEWETVVPELHRMGLVTIVDVPALEVYCRSVSEYRASESWLADHGRVTAEGYADPRVKMAHDAAQRVRQFASEFGLTPSARTRIRTSMGGSRDVSGKSRFFAG